MKRFIRKQNCTKTLETINIFITIWFLFLAVQSRIFELIGGFAKDYPDCIENEVGDGVKIRDMYFQTMEKAVVGQQEVKKNDLICRFNRY